MSSRIDRCNYVCKILTHQRRGAAEAQGTQEAFMSTDNDFVIVVLRVPKSQKAWLQQQARTEERSVNYVCRRIIDQAMDSQERDAA